MTTHPPAGPAPRPSPTIADWFAGARPRTLPAAVVPVAVGAGCAAGAGVSFGDGVVWWRAVGALAVSLLLQVGVNYANDYSDGVRGTDDVRVGPMRLVATGTASASAVKRAAMLAFLIAAAIGLLLAMATSWWLIAVGAIAILAAWGYTGGPKPYGYLGLGELFVFVFFGLVATVGTTYLAIERIPGVTWVAATGVGFLACALLVINNLRDIPTDTAVGKRTLAVRLGDAWTRRLYTVLVVGAFLAAAIAAGSRNWSLMAIGALPVAQAPITQVRSGAAGPALIPILGATGKVQLLYGLLFSIGLALG
jgi:1,4-dihydroxy-2-naphthoate polyprenyltransferase